MEGKLLHLNRLRNHVFTQLTELGYISKRNGTEIPIHCPFHNDSNPSLDVHVGEKITPGGFKCWSCGAHGGWNKLAKQMNLPLFVFDNTVFDANRKIKPGEQDSDPYKELAQSLKNTRLMFGQKEVHVLPGVEPLPDDFEWRGLPKRFYESLGGKFYWDKKLELDYLYLPITMNKKYMGYTICALQPAKLKYLTYADTDKSFLLFDQIPSGESVVVVEGHFDALRLYYEGIPAICIFGVENWSAIKKASLLSKAPKKIIICMDSDWQGRQAAEELFQDLKDCSNALIYQLPEDENKYDPGNMPDYMIEHLRSLL